MWLREDGSIAVETALSFLALMGLMLSIIECCTMVYTYAVLEEATREGLRYALIHGTDSTSCSGPGTSSGTTCPDPTGANVASTATTFARTYSGALSGLAVTVTYPDGNSQATSRVKVAAAYTYNSLFHFPGASHNLSVSSEGRILY